MAILNANNSPFMKKIVSAVEKNVMSLDLELPLI